MTWLRYPGIYLEGLKKIMVNFRKKIGGVPAYIRTENFPN
jgi:hypothetical protein